MDVLSDLIKELGRIKDLEEEVDRLTIDLNNERVARERVERTLGAVREKCKVLEASLPGDCITPEMEALIWEQGRDVTIEFRNKFDGGRRLIIKANGRNPVRARVQPGEVMLGKALGRFCVPSRTGEA